MTANESTATGLTCPKCGGAMRAYERNGITIDQCTDCRGIRPRRARAAHRGRGVLLVPLAALGVFGLAAVVAIHELAEVLVIDHGLRAGLGHALTLGLEPATARQ